MNGLSITMANAYKPLSNFKEMTVRVNKTFAIIRDRNVYINGIIRASLPFKNDELTIKRETTAFFVMSGKKWN